MKKLFEINISGTNVKNAFVSFEQVPFHKSDQLVYCVQLVPKHLHAIVHCIYRFIKNVSLFTCSHHEQAELVQD